MEPEYWLKRRIHDVRCGLTGDWEALRNSVEALLALRSPSPPSSSPASGRGGDRSGETTSPLMNNPEIAGVSLVRSHSPTSVIAPLPLAGEGKGCDGHGHRAGGATCDVKSSGSPDGGNPTPKTQGRRPGAPGRDCSRSGGSPARERLVEAIGARRSRMKVKRRKAGREGELVPSSDALCPLLPGMYWRRDYLEARWSYPRPSAGFRVTGTR